MNRNETFVLCFVFFCSTISAYAKLGDYITICNATDPDLEKCVINSTQHLIKKLKTGIPEYDISPIESMRVPIVDFQKSGMGLTLIIKNSSEDFGMKDLIFKKAIVNPKNYDFEFHTILPKHSMTGTYAVDGRFMMFPIMGQGKTTIILHDVQGKWKITGEPIEKNGLTYMRIKKFEVSIVPKQMKINLDDLFNGNKLLGDTLNKVLNVQWKDLYKYIKPNLDKAHADVLMPFTKKLFSTIPYNEMFINL